jgi:hypothetical protein
MGAMNAVGHVAAVGAGGDVTELWDLCEEMAERRRPGSGDGPVVHSTRGERESDGRGRGRFCFHPTGEEQHEFRADDLHDAMLTGAMWLAQCLPGDDLWRRG